LCLRGKGTKRDCKQRDQQCSFHGHSSNFLWLRIACYGGPFYSISSFFRHQASLSRTAYTFADAPAKTLGSHYTDIDRAAKVFALMLE
jgi:hypothetical protein